MLAGVLSIDRVLLVVAADDGPRPQTIEHLDILELIGVAEITGVVTKIDRAGSERAAAVIAEVATMLAAAGYPDAPIFPVSSHTGDGDCSTDPSFARRRPASPCRPHRRAASGSVSHADRPRIHPAGDRSCRDRHRHRRRGHGR